MASGTIKNTQKRQTLSTTALTNKIDETAGFSAIVVGNLLYLSGYIHIKTALSSNENVFAIGTGSGVRVSGQTYVLGFTGDNTVAPFALSNDNQNNRLLLTIYWGAGKVGYWNLTTCIPITFV